MGIRDSYGGNRAVHGAEDVVQSLLRSYSRARDVLQFVADIRRTRALTTLAERYCSESDLSMKTLGPVGEPR